MQVIRSPQRLFKTIAARKAKGARVGFVPTMGALHAGHESLVLRARKENDLVVASIYVNPLQFGPAEDFRRYPRTLARDKRVLRRAGCDVLFVPAHAQMYPDGFTTTVDVGRLGATLEGAARPGHFRGVATVVAKLLHCTAPSVLYLGQKDYQQALVLEAMIRDLDMPVRVRVCPIVRDGDGLALSSRNRYLTSRERARALHLYGALRFVVGEVRAGERSAARLRRRVAARLGSIAGLRLDYFALVDARNLRPMARLRGRVAALLAARVGRTRLIDNLLLRVS